jgi:hypothetical protein
MLTIIKHCHRISHRILLPDRVPRVSSLSCLSSSTAYTPNFKPPMSTACIYHEIACASWGENPCLSRMDCTLPRGIYAKLAETVLDYGCQIYRNDGLDENSSFHLPFTSKHRSSSTSYDVEARS